MFNFEKLNVYIQGLEIVKRIYQLTNNFPKSEIYGITEQLKRASISIITNIAEGSARYSKKDFVHFLRIANGSVLECVSLLQASKVLDYLKEEDYKQLYEQLTQLYRMINSLIKSFKKC